MLKSVRGCACIPYISGRSLCGVCYMLNFLLSSERTIIFASNISISKNKTFQPERPEMKLMFQRRGKGELKENIKWIYNGFYIIDYNSPK